MEVATGKFPDVPVRMDVMSLESFMSFLQIKLSMSLQEKIRQVRHEFC
jgi:hypothetical protein